MANPVPKLAVDQFAADLEKLQLDSAVKKVPNTSVAIPTFQRHGYMEKLGNTRKKWFKRFFVLRDSFLLAYNPEKSELTVEPRSCVHLANCKVQEMEHGDKLCMFITTTEKDQFVFAVATEEERKAWVKDIQIARTISHANMVKLSVENQFLAEEKGVGEKLREESASALAIFSNKQYIKKTPLVGGAEGWLFTPGFNTAHHKGNSLFSGKGKWDKHYFVLRDSHLLMFCGGDALTKPRGCMYLVGTQTEVVDQQEDKALFVFTCRSTECGDVIELAAHSEKHRKRWVNALRIGARVTFRDFKLLLKEHELLAKIKPIEPGSAGEADLEAARKQGEAGSGTLQPSVIEGDVDLQGQQLDPGVVQAYTAEGNPVLRDPDGKLVDSANGKPLEATEPRFAESGAQLDSFNRPLPEGSVPMFTALKQPIGVGPDGQHYLPDGTAVPKTDPHFDADGKKLPQSIVDAAGKVADSLNVAVKVRAHLKGEGAPAEAVDVLGRTFRQMEEDQAGMVVNADGDKVPVHTARVVDSGNNNEMVDYKTFRQKESKTHRDAGMTPIEERKGTVAIVVEDEDHKTHEIGKVDLEGMQSLRDVRQIIAGDLIGEDFVFLFKGLPLMKYEENDRMALTMGDAITIRPRKELRKIDRKMSHKRVENMSVYEQQKEKEKQEFNSIMAQIQSGTFLKPVLKDDAE